jgi:photosystem II stability/assembly factor-like uncharacterized protein
MEVDAMRSPLFVSLVIFFLAPCVFGFPETTVVRGDKPIRDMLTVVPKPEVELVLANISGDSLWKSISELSGEVPALIDGVPYTLLTRYSLSAMNDLAAEYLRERFESYGLEVEFSGSVMGKYDLRAGSFVDSDYGWVVGADQRVFKTRDGGNTWIRQKTGAFSSDFWGVCFIDSLKGWVGGIDGWVYGTSDGGATWNRKGPATRFPIFGVSFLDSSNGWIAGYTGNLARTTDGGQTWTAVSSGTSESLYRFYFRSPTRGWVCGTAGTMLFWDGASWTPQTTGAPGFLWGIDFVDDDTGWVVGEGKTILKTTDGGLNWVAQEAPSMANSYLIDVCFKDSTEGWVAGYLGTLLHTIDEGANWVRSDAIACSNHLRWIDFADSLNGWAAGLGCSILHSADGGTSWQNQTQNLPSGAWKLINNVVATKPGTVSDDQVMICGHYDSISEDPFNVAPGADDNASGSSGVLEAARVMAPYPYERTVKFICFSGEEMGPYGSGAYMDSVKQAGDVILGALNLDMIGYVDAIPEDVDIVANAASEWLADFMVDCGTAYVPTLPMLEIIDETHSGSDEISFWLAGYDALEIIEDSPPVHPAYHTTGDTLGLLTQTFATDVVKIAVATLAELAIPDTSASGVGGDRLAAIDRIHPNPFRENATISFAATRRTDLEVGIYNIEGRLVRGLLKGWAKPGSYDITWDGRNEVGALVSPGVYFVRVTNARQVTSAKAVLIR